MSRFRYGAAGLLAGLLVVVPQGAEAQAERGWWEWALGEAVEVAELRTLERDREREGARRGGRTLEDILFGRGNDRDRRDRDDDRDDDDWDDDDWEDDDRDRRERAREGRTDGRARGGPPFCRNGRGHPVHGVRWCRDKGFGQGRGSARWEDRGWEDIILGAPRGGERRRRTMDEGGLIDVLGDVVFGRLDEERRRLGGRSPLEGRWLEPRGGVRVLQIRSADVPVAELSDVNGDGRVDVTLVPRR